MELLCHSVTVAFETHTFPYVVQSSMNSIWFATLDTTELKDSWPVLSGRLLHPEGWNFTLSHYSHLL
jgi:hypothetical protein